MVGKVIPHGSSRVGFPQTSAYEKRKKDKKQRYRGMSWQKEYEAIGCSKNEASGNCERLDKAIKELESDIRKHKKELEDNEEKRCAASIALKANKGDKALYNALYEARQPVHKVRRKLIPLESKLRALRRELYYWNKIHDAAKSAHARSKGKGEKEEDDEEDEEEEDEEEEEEKEEREKVKGKGKGKMKVEDEDGQDNTATNPTSATWDSFNVEDNTERLDIRDMTANLSNQRQIVFAGTDYGIRKMSETVAQTLDELRVHLNRFQVLAGKTL